MFRQENWCEAASAGGRQQWNLGQLVLELFENVLVCEVALKDFFLVQLELVANEDRLGKAVVLLEAVDRPVLD